MIGDNSPFKEASYIKLDKSWAYENAKTEMTETDEEDGVTTEYKTGEFGYYKIVTVIENGIKTTTTYTDLQIWLTVLVGILYLKLLIWRLLKNDC
jgi:hypothetical protein